MTNENNIIKEEIKSLNWFDKNKFKKILAIIDSNEFSYRNKIGEFKQITLKTWLIILEIIQLVKQMLKKI